MAIRNGSTSPYVPGQFENDPGLAVERARRARLDGQEWNGFQYLSHFPTAPTHEDGQDLMWTERRNYFIDALQARDYSSAYHAMAGHGFPSGDRRVDAEFFAGTVQPGYRKHLRSEENRSVLAARVPIDASEYLTWHERRDPTELGDFALPNETPGPFRLAGFTDLKRDYAVTQ